ncbi:predicted protein [Arabidopsis lyrata subsp. lyrata]|uniref:Predicted protein n=1 Tax=Arabidopsis lyrata subsp. lyrata TaxID=81972 RepID=D7MMX0_ARALL|nr:predicted protein [Arabidopsis lyrata subsp. lyrata]
MEGNRDFSDSVDKCKLPNFFSFLVIFLLRAAPVSFEVSLGFVQIFMVCLPRFHYVRPSFED